MTCPLSARARKLKNVRARRMGPLLVIASPITLAACSSEHAVLVPVDGGAAYASTRAQVVATVLEAAALAPASTVLLVVNVHVDALPLDLCNAFVWRYGVLPAVMRVTSDADIVAQVRQHGELPAYPKDGTTWERGALYCNPRDRCLAVRDPVAPLVAALCATSTVDWARVLASLPRVSHSSAELGAAARVLGVAEALLCPLADVPRSASRLLVRLAERGTDYRVSPQDARTLADLAPFLLRCGRFQEAATYACSAGEAGAAAHPVLWKVQAIAAAAAKDGPRSASLYRRYRDALLVHAPLTSAALLHDVAAVQMLEQDWSGALGTALECVQLDPWFVEAYRTLYELSKLRVTNAPAQEAIFFFLTSLSLCTPSGRVEDREVVAYYTALLQAGRSEWSALYLFYFALYLQLQVPDEHTKPRKLLAQAMALLGDAPEPWAAPIIAQYAILEEQRSGRDVRELFDRALALNGDDCVVLLHYGCALAFGSHAEPARARVMLQRASLDVEPWTKISALVALGIAGHSDVTALREAVRDVCEHQPLLPELPLLRDRVAPAARNARGPEARLLAALLAKRPWNDLLEAVE